MVGAEEIPNRTLIGWQATLPAGPINVLRTPSFCEEAPPQKEQIAPPYLAGK